VANIAPDLDMEKLEWDAISRHGISVACLKELLRSVAAGFAQKTESLEADKGICVEVTWLESP